MSDGIICCLPNDKEELRDEILKLYCCAVIDEPLDTFRTTVKQQAEGQKNMLVNIMLSDLKNRLDALLKQDSRICSFNSNVFIMTGQLNELEVI